MIRRILVVFLTFLISIFPFTSGFADEKWKALDEAVIEKIAQERGKEPRPLFELEGDLEVFLFTLLAGVSGFIAGYFWRKFLDEERPTFERRSLTQVEGAERKG